MSRFAIKNWCPGALRPMLSGDGLVVRIRPHGSALSPAQAAGIANAAAKHGNGLINLTSRANLQLRGVDPSCHDELLADLATLVLIDRDVAAETRRNIIVTPLRCARHGPETIELAAALEEVLDHAPDLPSKFGFAIDTGEAPVLAEVSADVRLERTACGQLIVRADGAPCGSTVTRSEAPNAVLALASWFAESGGVQEGRGRMARHLANGSRPSNAQDWNALPATSVATPAPGPHDEGFFVAAEFGQLHAETLGKFAAMGREIRVTPWRMLFLSGISDVPDAEGLITKADDPRLNTTACIGAPGCLQAHAQTRELARALAPHVPKGSHLHVSGCAKGCAHPAPATVTLCATREGFDLIKNGRACDRSHRGNLIEEEILLLPHSLFEAS
jgi:precorrin-3B synthase